MMSYYRGMAVARWITDNPITADGNKLESFPFIRLEIARMVIHRVTLDWVIILIGLEESLHRQMVCRRLRLKLLNQRIQHQWILHQGILHQGILHRVPLLHRHRRVQRLRLKRRPSFRFCCSFIHSSLVWRFNSCTMCNSINYNKRTWYFHRVVISLLKFSIEIRRKELE
jgi:hypothetical protein